MTSDELDKRLESQKVQKKNKDTTFAIFLNVRETTIRRTTLTHFYFNTDWDITTMKIL